MEKDKEILWLSNNLIGKGIGEAEMIMGKYGQAQHIEGDYHVSDSFYAYEGDFEEGCGEYTYDYFVEEVNDIMHVRVEIEDDKIYEVDIWFKSDNQ